MLQLIPVIHRYRMIQIWIFLQVKMSAVSIPKLNIILYFHSTQNVLYIWFWMLFIWYQKSHSCWYLTYVMVIACDYFNSNIILPINKAGCWNTFVEILKLPFISAVFRHVIFWERPSHNFARCSSCSIIKPILFVVSGRLFTSGCFNWSAMKSIAHWHNAGKCW